MRGNDMGQLSTVLRLVENGHSHYCPGCQEMHVIPDGWSFDGNVETPTFSPSVKITGKQAVHVDGKWTGEFVLDSSGRALDYCCHYILTKGQLAFCSDSTHALAGQTVALPALPAWAQDEPALETQG